MKTEQECMEEMQRRCHFWLPNKRRLCANSPLPNSLFCGNHDPSRGGIRIPCPLDPSHSILKDNLDSHLKRCPLRKQSQALEAQPYYSKGINADDPEEIVTSETKRSAIYSLSVLEFHNLVDKIREIHSLVSGSLPDSYVMPKACEKWLKQQLDRQMPYQEKHAIQQASILGNMEKFGILRNLNEESMDRACEGCVGDDVLDEEHGEVPAVVEFGAGRGYLTQMLTDCYGIKKVFLVERKSYKLKADRSLRQVGSLSLERLRIDIEDLNLSAIESLRGFPYLAIGKHLCGPATDLTIRCCLLEQYNQSKIILSNSCHLQGLALATCCHHLCQWKHYINRKFLSNMGISKEDFHAITWLSSWAVDADHGSDLDDVINQGIDLNSREESILGDKGVEEAIRNMSALDRAVLGFMCKGIIDTGRLLWLREHGLDAQLVKYVPSSISPENHLLVANCSLQL